MHPEPAPVFVFDTCVFIAALRSRRGASFRLLELVGTGRFEIVLSLPLALEYEAVGRRHLPETTLNDAQFESILGYVYRTADFREIYYSWRPTLVDPGDDMILELAVAAGRATIVTFNKADFRGAERFGIRVCLPREVLAEVEGGRDVSTISVDIPESLHFAADELAQESGVTIQQLLASALAEKVSALGGANRLNARVGPADRAGFEEALSHVADIEPEEMDRL